MGFQIAGAPYSGSYNKGAILSNLLARLEAISDGRSGAKCSKLRC